MIYNDEIELTFRWSPSIIKLWPTENVYEQEIMTTAYKTFCLLGTGSNVNHICSNENSFDDHLKQKHKKFWSVLLMNIFLIIYSSQSNAVLICKVNILNNYHSSCFFLLFFTPALCCTMWHCNVIVSCNHAELWCILSVHWRQY